LTRQRRSRLRRVGTGCGQMLRRRHRVCRLLCVAGGRGFRRLARGVERGRRVLGRVVLPSLPNSFLYVMT